MSREGLRNFVRAVEHSAALRRQVIKAHVPNELITIAVSNGFAVREQDLRDDAICSDVQSWFDRSWIHPGKSKLGPIHLTDQHPS